MHTRSLLIATLVAVAAGGCADGAAGTGAECVTEGEQLETAKVYVEHNATDEDTGVHSLVGGEAWTHLCMWAPDDHLILDVGPEAQLGDLGIADLFFESREPPADEWSLDDLRAAFAEGDYRIGVMGQDGVPRVGVARFTHAIPSPPTITNPVVAEDEQAADSALVDPGGLVVRWEPVADTLAGDRIDISGYEVIVTKVDHEDPDGLSRPVYDVHVGPAATSLSVPPEFLEEGTVYELEVLALEASGNQTITVGFFATP